jgi:cyclic pyranopterin phosphate synthase
MLTHIDKNNLPTMVDITDKKVTERVATASAKVILPQNIVDLFEDGDLTTKKGPVIQTAIIAGTMAVKKTSELIPFCHPIALESIKINIQLESNVLNVQCRVRNTGKTGVEMEALQGVSTATLTIYDMCKAMSHDIQITDIQLEQKSGGKRDFKRN